MSPNFLERATFRAWDPRLVCVVTLALVFLCGAAAGAVVMSFGAHTQRHQAASDTPAGKAQYFARVQKELELTPEQAVKMQSILNDLWQYYRVVISDSRSRVEQVLTEAQRKKFERLLQQQQPR